MNKHRVYTSYYAKIGKFDPNKYLRIQISKGCPTPNFIDLRFKSLEPSTELLSGIKSGLFDEFTYNDRYTKQLNEIGWNTLYNQFSRLIAATDRDLVLFCYESPEKFCHRHILANWFNQYPPCDLIIKEYEDL
jgi:uncharacterized protein YeaO (DUF488 family)